MRNMERAVAMTRGSVRKVIEKDEKKTVENATEQGQHRRFAELGLGTPPKSGTA